jgi:hypothetical protein
MLFRRSKCGKKKDSEKALEDARKNLSEVQERSAEVSTISNALKDIREANHFMQQFEELIIYRRGAPQ